MGKSEPHFILEGASRFDIEQGCAGKNTTSSLLAVRHGRLLQVSLRDRKGWRVMPTRPSEFCPSCREGEASPLSAAVDTLLMPRPAAC